MNIKEAILKRKDFTFQLFASTINVVWENQKMNDKQNYGETDYSQCKISMSSTNGLDDLSEDRILDTYYHEKVHMILDFMHEYELSKNEKFVDAFGKLLRQSDETLQQE